MSLVLKLTDGSNTWECIKDRIKYEFAKINDQDYSLVFENLIFLYA